MQVIHPQNNPYQLPAEDVFVAVDDMGTEQGRGFIIYLYQPNLYPDCPVNLYFSIQSQPAARYLIFGALMARARQLREQQPDMQARVYTDMNPNDANMRQFYLDGGFLCQDTEEAVVMPMPFGDGRIPMSCTVAQTPLNTQEDINALISRLQQNDISYINQDLLANLMRQPHFLCLGLYRSMTLVGEIVMAGVADQCDLLGIYIEPNSRRQGMARALLHRSMAVMATEGVTHVNARVMTRSDAQVRLMRSFQASSLGITTVYPSLYL